MAVAPITPHEIAPREIPDFVVESFNALLTREYRNGEATILQSDVIDLIMTTTPAPMERQTIFDRNWLDVERDFENAGWSVTYVKGPYCDSAPPFFEFRKR
jgi:hypothetical protein